MERVENIFIAKRVLVDNIYRSAKLEGLAVTFAQTMDIVEELNSGDLSVNTINDILNLKNAWKYILEMLDEELSLALLKNIHGVIGRGMDIPFSEIGEFRKTGVAIGGTAWRPETPKEEKKYAELIEIKRIDDCEDRSITLFLWIMRSQMFRDGNKRVANLVANFELIRNGKGLLSIPENNISEFKNLLVDFYETNNDEKIRKFLKYKCVYRDMEFLSDEQRQK